MNSRRPKYAKVAGEDSGLVYDDFVKQAVESGRPLQDKQGRAILDANGESRVYLTAETAAKVNRVAKALGVRVQFVDSVRGGTAMPRSAAARCWWNGTMKTLYWLLWATR